MRRRTSRPVPAPNSIALIQRGGCDFVVKIANAVARRLRGAVLISNDGCPADPTEGEPFEIGAEPVHHDSGGHDELELSALDTARCGGPEP